MRGPARPGKALVGLSGHPKVQLSDRRFRSSSLGCVLASPLVGRVALASSWFASPLSLLPSRSLSLFSPFFPLPSTANFRALRFGSSDRVLPISYSPAWLPFRLVSWPLYFVPSVHVAFSWLCLTYIPCPRGISGSSHGWLGVLPFGGSFAIRRPENRRVIQSLPRCTPMMEYCLLLRLRQRSL